MDQQHSRKIEVEIGVKALIGALAGSGAICTVAAIGFVSVCDLAGRPAPIWPTDQTRILSAEDDAGFPKLAKSLQSADVQQALSVVGSKAASGGTGIGGTGPVQTSGNSNAGPGGLPAGTQIGGLPAADLEAFVQRFSHGQLKYVSSTPGPAGMIALNLAPVAGGQSIIGWLAPGNAGIIFGPFFDGNGVNLNLAAGHALGIQGAPGGETEHAPNGEATSGAEVMKNMTGSSLAGFSEGHGPAKVSVFFDANCSVCHDLWEKLQADQGWQQRLTVTWLPVGAFKETSMGKGAALLAGGPNALAYNEQHFDAAAEDGGISVSNDEKLLSKVKSNTDTWLKIVASTKQTPGTPTIVINDEKVVVGLPSSEQMLATTGIQFP